MQMTETLKGKAENTSSFGRSMKAANLPAF